MMSTAMPAGEALPPRTLSFIGSTFSEPVINGLFEGGLRGAYLGWWRIGLWRGARRSLVGDRTPNIGRFDLSLRRPCLSGFALGSLALCPFELGLLALDGFLLNGRQTFLGSTPFCHLLFVQRDGARLD